MCITERETLIAEQQGAVKCDQCQQWFITREDRQCKSTKLCDLYFYVVPLIRRAI